MPKISKPLTTTEVKNYKPESKMYKKPDGKGLWLIVNPNGTKFWRYDFKYGNKNLSMSFGIYPEIGLKEARDKREEARELLTNNINPISLKRIKKASESLTLQNVIDEWIELRKKSSSEATIIQNKRILKNISDWLGSVAIKDIKQLLTDINSIGEKLRSDISTIFIFKLIPYVFVRSENIRLMCWDDLNLEKGIWEIPKEKMKMKVDFVCPLPTQAIKILKQIELFSKHRGKFVFPSPYKNDRGVSGATLSDTLNKLGYQNKHSFHGFRSMFSTIAHELYKEHGFHSDIIEACLAHKEKNKIKAAYNRESKFKYFEEKKELIQWYANWLDKLIEI